MFLQEHTCLLRQLLCYFPLFYKNISNVANIVIYYNEEIWRLAKIILIQGMFHVKHSWNEMFCTRHKYRG